MKAIKDFWNKYILPELNVYFIFAALISTFSAPLDGGFLARLMPAFMAYALNFVADIATERMVRDFAHILKTGRRNEKGKHSQRWWLAWLIVPFAAANSFFSWLFAWQTLSYSVVDLDPNVAIVAAGFGPIIVLGIGICEAIMRSTPKKPKADEPKKPVPLTQADFQKWLSTAGDNPKVKVAMAELSGTYILPSQRTLYVWMKDNGN